MLNPVALSILTSFFRDRRERTRAIDLWSATVGVSLSVGPVVGGLLVAATGWRSIFLINVPIGVLALVLTAVFVPESRAATARRADPVGQALAVTLLATLIVAIIEGSRHGYGSFLIIGLFLLTATAAAALPAYERRRDQPLIDPAFFRSVPFTGASIAAVTAFVTLSGFLFLNTLYLQEVRGYSALHAGLLTVPMAVGAVIASPVSGRLTAARGPRPPLVAAGLLTVAAALTLTTLTPTTSLAVLLAAYALLGIGSGLVNTPITSMATAGMPRAQAGVSAAITTTGRQIGNSLGVAVLGAIVTSRTRGLPGGFATASHLGWWILTGCGVLIAVIGVVSTTGRDAERRFRGSPGAAPSASASRWLSRGSRARRTDGARPHWRQTRKGRSPRHLDIAPRLRPLPSPTGPAPSRDARARSQCHRRRARPGGGDEDRPTSNRPPRPRNRRVP